jgi:hypothetical protein
MIIELHDSEVDNKHEGSLAGRVGREGTIEYAYQGEMWVQEIFGDEPSIVRAYAIIGGEVAVIWHKNSEGVVSYVARSNYWEGQWQLPFLYSSTLIAQAMLGRGVNSMEEAAQWAELTLQGDCACAVLMDNDGFVAAWEMGPEGLILAARSPRSASIAAH